MNYNSMSKDELINKLCAADDLNERLLCQVSYLNGLVAQAKTKDVLIEVLRARIASISAEYNNKHYRKGTTLGDVHKLSGEV